MNSRASKASGRSPIFALSIDSPLTHIEHLGSHPRLEVLTLTCDKQKDGDFKVPVQVEKPTRGQVEDWVETQANLESDQRAKILAEVSKGLGAAMSGIDIRSLGPEELLATRGW